MPSPESSEVPRTEQPEPPLATPLAAPAGNIATVTGTPLPSPIEVEIPRTGSIARSMPPSTTGLPVGGSDLPGLQARRDPSKPSDALWIQGRLREFGFYFGQERNWGQLSREALRNFKATNGLALDDKWDQATEDRLSGAGLTRAEQTFLGGWAPSPNECLARGSAAPPMRISSRSAQSNGGRCDFTDIRREGVAWRVQANCVVGDKRWSSNIRFTVTGKTLTWSSGRGTETYHRCR